MKNRSRGTSRDPRGPRIEKITTSDLWGPRSFFLSRACRLGPPGLAGLSRRTGGDCVTMLS
eukprot:9473508-Pyramimonas_sp.AAC.1